MATQPAGPLVHIPMAASARPAADMVHSIVKGDVDLDPPYQRGHVWTATQRVALIRSITLGVPIAAIILNDRMGGGWPINHDAGEPIYAVIDGKQRLSTLRLWFAGSLAVPAAWFPADEVDCADGDYLRYSGLTRTAQRRWENRAVLATVTAQLRTLAAEAEVYGLVNGGGTPQTAADMARAAAVAESQ